MKKTFNTIMLLLFAGNSLYALMPAALTFSENEKQSFYGLRPETFKKTRSVDSIPPHIDAIPQIQKLRSLKKTITNTNMTLGAKRAFKRPAMGVWYNWNTFNNQWEYSTNNHYTYNSDSRITRYVEVDTITMDTLSIETMAYNQHGKIVSIREYEKDINNEWKNFYLDSSEYSDVNPDYQTAGYTIQSVDNNGIQELLYGWKFLFEQKNGIISAKNAYTYESQTWTLIQRHEYTYDFKGNLSIISFPDQEFKIEFQHNNSVLTNEIYSEWLEADQKWAAAVKIEYNFANYNKSTADYFIYDFDIAEDAKMTFSMVSYWDADNFNWLNSDRTSTTRGSQTITLSETWNDVSWIPVNRSTVTKTKEFTSEFTEKFAGNIGKPYSIDSTFTNQYEEYYGEFTAYVDNDKWIVMSRSNKTIDTYTPSGELAYKLNRGYKNSSTTPQNNTIEVYIGEIPKNTTTVLTEQTNGLSIYPNPFQSNLQVELDGHIDGFCKILLTDLSGRIVYLSEKHLTNQSIDLSALQKGTYILYVVYGDNQSTQTVSKL